ncbi:MAG: ABC transporter substrate-binding protein [Planctomycetes bacterium]|nr:ABC transporter substrate-binding protein [Planctomycetota bacterium]
MKLFAIVAAACCLAVHAVAAEPVRVGVFLPLSGHKAYAGRVEFAGIELAHSLFPEIAGRPVELYVRDNRSDSDGAAAAVRQLIEEDRVSAILGSYGSDLAIAGSAVAEAAGIPTIGTSCTSPLVTRGKRHIFRACFTDDDQGAGAATYAIVVRGFRRAAILTTRDSIHSTGAAERFREAFIRLGGKIVAESDCLTGDRDFSEQLAVIREAQPDVLFMPMYFPEGSAIMTQSHAAGDDFVIMSTDSMDNPDIVKELGKVAEGFIQTTFPYSPLMAVMSPEAEEFTNDWMEKFPDDLPSPGAALGYTSYCMLKDAMERAGSADPDALTHALAEIKTLPSPEVPITL